MRKHLALLLIKASQRARATRADDRGELSSSIAFVGVMMLIAAAVGAIFYDQIVSAAESINFGF